MSTIRPFCALRPTPPNVERVASVPSDVVTTEEAKALAAGHPHSLLHVARAEIGLPITTDPYSDVVYQTALANLERIKLEAPLVVEDEPSLYLYRLRMGQHVQTGLVACYSVDEYEQDLIKKHEKTRKEKEDDRTRHIITTKAQTGPVFLTYRATKAIDAIVAQVTAGAPLFDFTAIDTVRHTAWRVTGPPMERLVEEFGRLPCLYIADGHHRAASAARTRTHLAMAGVAGAEAPWMLAVAFPDDQMQVLPYNRVVRDLAGRSPETFLAEVTARFTVKPGTPSPTRKGEASMYLGGRWYTIVLADKAPKGSTDPIATLDVSILQEHLLAPLLKIEDPRTDKRIDFVGGIRGTAELEKLVGSGKAAVAFSMVPVRVDDLMKIADAGGIMPPKSTWFEPKLRDGLFIHTL
jgi:uncharacterized protein (DUF1015 family)